MLCRARWLRFRAGSQSSSLLLDEVDRLLKMYIKLSGERWTRFRFFVYEKNSKHVKFNLIKRKIESQNDCKNYYSNQIKSCLASSDVQVISSFTLMFLDALMNTIHVIISIKVRVEMLQITKHERTHEAHNYLHT